MLHPLDKFEEFCELTILGESCCTTELFWLFDCIKFGWCHAFVAADNERDEKNELAAKLGSLKEVLHELDISPMLIPFIEEQYDDAFRKFMFESAFFI